MCLYHREETDVKMKQAWKLFSFNDVNNTLQSAFTSAKRLEPSILEDGLHYPLNNKLQVRPFSSCFYSFKEYEDAVHIIDHDFEWHLEPFPLIVLPVTIYNVTHTGFLEIDTIAFESKEIVVFSKEDSRTNTYHNFSNNEVERFSKTFNVKLMKDKISWN